MMSLALHQRYEIIFLAKNIYGPKFSQTKIAKIMRCHRNTVKRWLDRWEETKDPSDSSRPRAPRSITAKDNQLMIDLTTEEINTTSETVKQELEKKRVLTSNRTIRRRLHETGLQYMRPLLKPLLNEQHRQRRVQWTREMKNYDRSLVMASDETIIRLHTSRKFSWQRPGERKIAPTVKFSMSGIAFLSKDSDASATLLMV